MSEHFTDEQILELEVMVANAIDKRMATGCPSGQKCSQTHKFVKLMGDVNVLSYKTSDVSFEVQFLHALKKYVAPVIISVVLVIVTLAIVRACA